MQQTLTLYNLFFIYIQSQTIPCVVDASRYIIGYMHDYLGILCSYLKCQQDTKMWVIPLYESSTFYICSSLQDCTYFGNLVSSMSVNILCMGIVFLLWWLLLVKVPTLVTICLVGCWLITFSFLRLTIKGSDQNGFYSTRLIILLLD